jgi:hypothetical protein
VPAAAGRVQGGCLESLGEDEVVCIARIGDGDRSGRDDATSYCLDELVVLSGRARVVEPLRAQPETSCERGQLGWAVGQQL